MEPNPKVEIASERIDLLFEAAVASAPRWVGEGGLPYSVVPEGFQVESLERFLATAARKRAAAVFEDAASFVGYLKAHGEERSALFAREKALRIEAILDYHSPRAAGFCEHRAVLQLEPTPEWKAWTGQSGKPQSQAAFAQFLEDNLPDILEPSGATMLEVARRLEAERKVSFLSAVRLTDGNRQFIYQEQTDASSAKGALQVPETFKLALPPFARGPRYELTARLRYRIDDGKLQLWFDLLRPHKVIEAVFDELVAKVGQELAIDVRRGQVEVPKWGD